MEPLVALVFRACDFSFSAAICRSRMLPSPVGDGNWSSLKSVDADSMLACRSSKLTEGRKSSVPGFWPLFILAVSELPEKNVWPTVEDVLSIGAWDSRLELVDVDSCSGLEARGELLLGRRVSKRGENEKKKEIR